MPSRARLLVLVVTVLAAVATLAVVDVGGGAAAGVPTAARATVRWAKCRDPYLQYLGAQCAQLTVPLDHARPHGPTVQVAVSRVLHTRKPYRGAVFTNAGGPGGDGRYLAGAGQSLPGKVGSTYDWYGFSPRGVGDSVPHLSCDRSITGYGRPSYEPSTKKLLRYWDRRTAGYAKACGRSSGRRLLGHLRTVDEVGDYESLRRAIGAKRVTFYGFSYGTYVAQVYATLHPEALKAVVMDGVIDPTRVWHDTNLDQDRAFQVTIRRFFAWLAQHADTYHVGTTGKRVEATYERLSRQLTRHAAKGRLGPSELVDAMLGAAYYNTTWLSVGQAFSDLARGDAQPMLDLYGGPGDDAGYAAYLGTECTDAPWPAKLSTYVGENRRVDRRAPFETWSNAWFNAPCRAWPAKAHRPVAVSGAGYHRPMLLLSEQFDGATPYSGALQVRRIFGQARLVEGRGGTSHAVSMDNPCTAKRVVAFLENGSVPRRVKGDRADAVCPGLRPPSPGSGRTARRQALSSPPRWLLSTTSH